MSEGAAVGPQTPLQKEEQWRKKASASLKPGLEHRSLQQNAGKDVQAYESKNTSFADAHGEMICSRSWFVDMECNRWTHSFMQVVRGHGISPLDTQ